MRRAIPILIGCAGLSMLVSGSWIHAKAGLAQVLLERAWQETRDGDANVKPWPWADTWPVARLKIPRLDATMIVLSGASGRTLAFGPGHTPGTALPGHPGTAIVSGHRDTHFAVMRGLRVGDELEVERSDGQRALYQIEAIDVVDSRDTRLRAARDGRALVLVTCWPFNAVVPGGAMRYVATARSATF
jgi:sortase A